jgi:hypothetical protein
MEPDAHTGRRKSWTKMYPKKRVVLSIVNGTDLQDHNVFREDTDAAFTIDNKIS